MLCGLRDVLFFVFAFVGTAPAASCKYQEKNDKQQVPNGSH